MKRKTRPCSPYEQLSDPEKLRYRENVLNLSEKIISDESKVKRLTTQTLRNIKKFSNHHSINGRVAEDFIQDAILKTALGNRFFGGKTEEELLKHYYHIIPSLIWNEIKKSTTNTIYEDESGQKCNNRKNKFLPVNHTDYDDEEENIQEIILKGTDTSQLDKIIFQEIIDETESYIYKEFEKSEDYIGPYLYEAHINGVSEPHKFVSESLNIPIEDVRNADRRLKRNINKAKRFYNEG